MPTPGGKPFKYWDDAEAHHTRFPTLQCQPVQKGIASCGERFRGFEGDDGRPCPFCAQRDKQSGQIVGYRGSWVKLSLEVVAPEVFDGSGNPVRPKAA